MRWLFIIGLAVDVAGAATIAWPIFYARRGELREEGTMRWGRNAWVIVARTREQRFVRLGVILLGLGFVCQLVAYIVQLTSHSARTMGSPMTTKTGHLEPRDRLLAPVAVRNAAGEVVGANLGAFVRRLILFEQVILDSYGMRELPALINALGPDSFTALVQSEAVTIRADGWTFGEIGAGGLVPGYGDAPLPLLSYSLSPIVPHDRERHIHLCLGEIRAMDTLGKKTSQRVRNAIVDALVTFPDAGSLSKPFRGTSR